MFNNLKVGDKVGVTYGGNNSYSRPYKISTVVRTTATQIILDSDKKYKHCGREVGGDAYGGYLVSLETAEKHNEELCRVKALRNIANDLTALVEKNTERYTRYGSTCSKGLTQEEKDAIIALVNAL